MTPATVLFCAETGFFVFQNKPRLTDRQTFWRVFLPAFFSSLKGELAGGFEQDWGRVLKNFFKVTYKVLHWSDKFGTSFVEQSSENWMDFIKVLSSINPPGLYGKLFSGTRQREPGECVMLPASSTLQTRPTKKLQAGPASLSSLSIINQRKNIKLSLHFHIYIILWFSLKYQFPPTWLGA